jgi:hypothetical protein
MDPRELRIGNLVTDEFYDTFSKTIEVESINEKGINLEIENSDDYPEMQRHWIEPYYTFEQLRGIPLTCEWLMRFGYQEYYRSEWQIKYEKPDVLLHLMVKENRTMAFVQGTYVKDIKDIHDFQNLYFTLKGEELKSSVPPLTQKPQEQ